MLSFKQFDLFFPVDWCSHPSFFLNPNVASSLFLIVDLLSKLYQQGLEIKTFSVRKNNFWYIFWRVLERHFVSLFTARGYESRVYCEQSDPDCMAHKGAKVPLTSELKSLFLGQ